MYVSCDSCIYLNCPSFFNSLLSLSVSFSLLPSFLLLTGKAVVFLDTNLCNERNNIIYEIPRKYLCWRRSCVFLAIVAYLIVVGLSVLTLVELQHVSLLLDVSLCLLAWVDSFASSFRCTHIPCTKQTDSLQNERAVINLLATNSSEGRSSLSNSTELSHVLAEVAKNEWHLLFINAYVLLGLEVCAMPCLLVSFFLWKDFKKTRWLFWIG